MSMHPWKRAPHLATTLGLMMGAGGIIITSLNIKQVILKTIFITLGSMALLAVTILFLTILSLAIRDYREQYPEYKNKLFGIPWLKY